MDYILMIVIMFWVGWYSGQTTRDDEIKTKCLTEQSIKLGDARFKCEYIGKQL